MGGGIKGSKKSLLDFGGGAGSAGGDCDCCYVIFSFSRGTICKKRTERDFVGSRRDVCIAINIQRFSFYYAGWAVVMRWWWLFDGDDGDGGD